MAAGHETGALRRRAAQAALGMEGGEEKVWSKTRTNVGEVWMSRGRGLKMRERKTRCCISLIDIDASYRVRGLPVRCLGECDRAGT